MSAILTNDAVTSGAATAPLKNPSPHSRQRLTQLDALRGLAAMSVVLFHFTSGYSKALSAHSVPLFSVSSGSIGVQLFFAISGFVIFMTLERTSGIAQFAQSRFARLYPTYIVCVSITLLSIFITGINYRNIDLLTIMSAPLLATGIVNRLYVDSSYWTLTLEVCFYAWAGLAFFYGRAKCLLLFVLIWIPLSTLLRVWGIAEYYPRLNALLLAEYFHWFAIGIAIYCLHERRNLFIASVILALAMASSTMAVDASLVHFHGKELIKALLLASLVYGAARGSLRLLNLAPLLYLGSISYALFLIHQVLGFNLLILMEGAGIPLNMGIPVVIGLSILLAAGVRRFVEIPAYRALSSRQQPAVAS